MTNTTKKSRTISLFLLIIIISLLLHMVGLFLFLSWKYDTNFFKEMLSSPHTATRHQLQSPTPSVPDQQHDDPDMQAELKARDSSFGAPVVFEDMQPEATQKEEQQNDTVEHEDHTNDAEETNDTEQTTHEEKKEELAEEPIQKDVTHPEEHSDGPAQKLEKIAMPVTPERKRRRRRKKKSNQAQTEQYQQVPVDENKLSFAKLAQGFLDTLNEGGQDWFSRKGDPNKRPDHDELKYLSYTQKIAWYLQQAWHANPPTITRAIPGSPVLYVHLIINKEGELADLIVIQKSGVDEFDTTILQGIKTAGPFPPLPAHFNKEQLDVKFGIHLTAQQGGIRVGSRKRVGLL